MSDIEEIKNLVKENIELSEETLRLVKKMRRAHLIGRAFKILYWIVILAVMFGAYYYFQPLIGDFINAYQDIISDLEKLKTSVGNLPLPQ